MKNLFLFILFVFSFALQAQEDDLDKKIQNPIADIITLPFQNNTDYGVGTYDRHRNTLNIQPVYPFALNPDYNVIMRTIIPVMSVPVDENETRTGLADINMSLFVTPRLPGKTVWGIGPVLSFPTATEDAIKSKKWSAGPAFLVLIQPPGWTVGTLVQNTWSYAGDKDYTNVNFFYSQVFITKMLPNSWYINSAPIITANWNADKGNQWTVPLGLGGGKLFRFGKLPVNIQTGFYYYVASPDNGPEWQMRWQVNFVLPKSGGKN